MAFQDNGGKKQIVEVAYAVRDNEYGFTLGGYDPTKVLVIDPILAATFIGGSVQSGISALALDSMGNVYVAGVTQSPDFPGIGPGSADGTFESIEGFVVKLNSDLSSILAATFLGGNFIERATALAINGEGNVYVAGDTFSADFPGVDSGSADRRAKR